MIQAVRRLRATQPVEQANRAPRPSAAAQETPSDMPFAPIPVQHGNGGHLEAFGDTQLAGVRVRSRTVQIPDGQRDPGARVAQFRGAWVPVADAQMRVLHARRNGRMADGALLVERV